MAESAIEVENLSKCYRIGAKEESNKTFREVAVDAFLAPVRNLRRLMKLTRFEANSLNGTDGSSAAESSDIIWALKDVSFEVREGEVLGIIGRNGAGKSTLLKILSRITEPTTGEIKLYGRVSSLLEVGTGFHPELSGRENIYLNAAILGMRKTDIERRFEEIVAFAEIENFIDTPVKRYSSGMYVRLAFSVAAHLEPEVLLVDEVLAVGDAQFQKKCIGKMSDIANVGRTVFFVSHNLASISSLCNRCIYMDGGRIRGQGSPDEIIRKYLTDCEQRTMGVALAERKDRKGSGLIRLTSIEFFDKKSKKPTEVVLSGQDVYIEITYKAEPSFLNRQLKNVSVGLAFLNSSGQFVTVLNSQMANKEFGILPSEGSIYCHIPRFPLMVGNFNITATVYVGGGLADQVSNAYDLTVLEGDFFGSGFPNTAGRQGVYIDHAWIREIK